VCEIALPVIQEVLTEFQLHIVVRHTSSHLVIHDHQQIQIAVLVQIREHSSFDEKATGAVLVQGLQRELSVAVIHQQSCAADVGVRIQITVDVGE